MNTLEIADRLREQLAQQLTGIALGARLLQQKLTLSTVPNAAGDAARIAALADTAATEACALAHEIIQGIHECSYPSSLVDRL